MSIPTAPGKPGSTLSALHLALLQVVIYHFLLIISAPATVERNRVMLSCITTEKDIEKETDDLHKAPQGSRALFSSAPRGYYRTITDSCTSTSPSPLPHGQ